MRSSAYSSKLHHRFTRQIAAVCAVVVSMMMSACVIVPVRLPTQIRDISGNPQNLDFAFLKAGLTQREEVLTRLAAIDTRTDQPEFFWGRWESSKWAVGGVVALPAAAGAGGSRIWGAHNLLIAFDDNGTVKNWVALNDHKLLQQLELLDTGSTDRLDLSSPLHAKVLLPQSNQDAKENRSGDLVLSADFLECTELKVSPAEIGKITTIAEQAVKPSPGYIWITIHMRRKRRLGNAYSIGVDPPT